jgi:proline iminopeptidase
MKTLYPAIQPFHQFFLDTNSPHRVYVEQSGNPDGIPVIFLHGGPCSGTKPHHRQFFNPERYHIILFDQRGCGWSEPFGELDGNTTQDLCVDMERIRTTLNIKQWLVFGGSWGGALALLYAEQHSECVLGLIIRAVFLARQQDMDWFAKDGVSRIYPEQWQRLVASIPNASHTNLVEACYQALWANDELTQRRVAKEWLAWGAQVALGNAYQASDEHVTEKMLKQARMELHYAKYHYFIAENQILANCHRLENIPTVIIHGRMDLVCPIEAGLSLYHAMSHAHYVILSNAGHIAQGDEMINALVSATDEFAERFQ